MSKSLDELCVNTIRMLSIDAVQKANSGHPGMPMGAATMAYILWTRHLRHNPRNPGWPDRDRFVLSAGHASMLLYSLLLLTGYDLTLDDLEQFRQWASRTPGHPERGCTPGVEVTTGPLGQGFANSVGLAMAERWLAATFNRPGADDIVDHYTYVLASDGDLMEGVASEAASLAGTLGLARLIVLYDSNLITLSGTTNVTFTEDVAARFEAYGWHVQRIDGHDPTAVDDALTIARAVANRPSARALIVRPIPPFRLDFTVWALRRRARNKIDRWDGMTYRRVIAIRGRPIELAIRQEGSLTRPRLLVTATPSLRTPAERQLVRSVIDRLLGVRIDLRDWYRMAQRHEKLRQLADRFRGMKPPRFPTVFETLVNAFACQQLSLVVGLELLNRLVAACDVRTGTGDRAHYAFPAAHDVSRIPPATYHAIGFSRQKVHALLTLARGIDQGEINVEHVVRDDDQQATGRLRELRGVGRWTAEYVLLRGLGRLHVFPGDDVGAQKSLARWLGRLDSLDYAGVNRAVAKWQPYAGLLYFHLLLDGLSKVGAIGHI